MAVLSGTAYRSGRSTLHLMDARFKLVALITLSLACLQSDAVGLSLLTPFLIVALITASVPVIVLLRELKWLGLLLFLIVVSRTAFTDGPAAIRVPLVPVTLSLAGAAEGGLIAWRLVLVVLGGILFTISTRSAEISTAVAWFLAPVPLVNGRRLGTMMGLILRFIPEIIRQTGRTADALKARGIESRVNPVRRIVYTAIPMLRNVALTSDNLALAMEARCYTDERTPPAFQVGKRDWTILLTLIFLCAAAVSL